LARGALRSFQGIEVRATEQLYADADATKKSEQPLFVCIGDNAVRKKIATAIDAPMMVARHRSAEISPTASVAGGTMVFHGSYIQAGATLGHHVIVNTAASVDHDCRIADFVHIAPQVGLSGGVEIGEGSEIGVGACVLPNIHIGKWTKVGAGATVIKDLPDFAVAVGTPAKVIRLNGATWVSRLPAQPAPGPLPDCARLAGRFDATSDK